MLSTVTVSGILLLFAAGVYIFASTLFELFGFRAVTTKGTSMALPDTAFRTVNGAYDKMRRELTEKESY